MSRRRPHLITTAITAVVATVAAVAIVGTGALAGPGASSAQAATAARGTGVGYLHTDGAQIVDSTGAPVRLTGVNWFGGETTNNTFHGLWARNYEDMLDQVADLGYNTLRLPYSNDLFKSSTTVSSINYDLNPDLVGLTPLQVFDKVIAYAGTKGLRVVLDRHRPDSSAQSSLWYTSAVPESTWIANWEALATRYDGNPTVVGADLHNEPYNANSTTSGACWGCGDTARDWRLAAERAGAAIQAVNPDWLIIVEGVDSVPELTTGWWGGNLAAADDYPVRLPVADHLVYSAHEYAISVYHQSWFDDATFPANMTSFWDQHWGYLVKQDVAPVLIGEFGSTLADPKDVTWMKALLEYMGTGPTGMSFTYWSLNPNSGDTGGILNDDWTTVNATKQAILEPYLEGVDGPVTTGTATSTTSPTTSSPTTPVTTGTGACTATTALQTWNGGFLANVTVTNTGAAATDWKVTMTVPSGVTLGSGWGGTFTQSGTTLTVTAPAWNGTLATGGQASLGFTATGTATAAVTGITLNGATCS